MPQIDYSCFIAAQPSLVYEYLSEPEHYRGLQPLVVAVRDVEHGEDSEGHPIRRYVAVERIRFFGVLNYYNPIRVLITLAKPGELLINDVEARLNVRLRFVTTFKHENGGTQLDENITIHAPRLLQSYVASQAKAAQDARFRKLKSLLEADQTRS